MFHPLFSSQQWTASLGRFLYGRACVCLLGMVCSGQGTPGKWYTHHLFGDYSNSSLSLKPLYYCLLLRYPVIHSVQVLKLRSWEIQDWVCGLYCEWTRNLKAIFILLLLFWHWISHSPRWPWTHCIAEAGLESLILLPPALNCELALPHLAQNKCLKFT